jgi:hypothetical protein
MSAFLGLPFDVLKFWYFDAPLELIRFFLSLNASFNQLFSLPLLLRTFFKPIKNEYRKGLVGFSIGMGIVVKSALIFADGFLLLMLLAFEIIVLFLFLVFPVFAVYLLISTFL